MTTKHFPVLIEKSTTEGYDAKFVMSAATPDRVADTIAPKAYEANVGKKIIALWQHDPDKPMGYWENVKMTGDKLVGDLKISSTNLGLMIKQLIADDVPLGASIGFRGAGTQNKNGGVHFTKVDIFETSVVSIPAHPRAMQIAKSFGMEEFVTPLSSGIDESAASGHNLDEILQKSRSATLAANKTLRGNKR
jgi:HK97 family phage prohead protease